MGGKVWSKTEEMIFWCMLAMLFPPGLHQQTKDVKHSRKDLLKSWAPFPKMMQDLWHQHNPGKDFPRNYTPVSMYEHYFQNFVQGKLSPNAKAYLDQYKAWLDKEAADSVSGSDNEASESRETSAPEESSDDDASYDQGNQERLIKRLRMTSEGCHDANVSASPVLANQNRMPVQHDTIAGGMFSGLSRPVHELPQAAYELSGSSHWFAHLNIGGAKRFAVWTPKGSIFPEPISMNQASVNHNSSHFSEQNIGGGSQFPPVMPDMRGAPTNNWDQVNMGAAYSELITGHHGAQNDGNFVMHQDAVQPDYNVFTSSDGAQYDANFVMHQDAVRPGYGVFTGSDGGQKRKRSDYE